METKATGNERRDNTLCVVIDWLREGKTVKQIEEALAGRTDLYPYKERKLYAIQKDFKAEKYSKQEPPTSGQVNTEQDTRIQPDVRQAESHEDDVASTSDICDQSCDIQISPEVVDRLMKMLDWWEKDRTQPAQVTERPERPIFNRKSTCTCTIRLSVKLVEAADKYIKKNRASTGGSFSTFCELLIWDALGRDPKFVKAEPQESDE